MNDQFSQDAGTNDLGRLLRKARPEPSLPPGFQQAVWRQVEKIGAANQRNSAIRWTPGALLRWLDRLIPQPRLALAALSAMLLLGATLGVRQGTEQAKFDAKARYFAAVSPTPLR